MDDSTLIEQIQLGSKDAFKQMFIKFYSPLCEYASQYVSDEDAEELIQELMLFIWENRNSLFVEISLKSYLLWLLSIVASMRSKGNCIMSEYIAWFMIRLKINLRILIPISLTSLQRISRKRSKNCLRITGRHLNLADSESNLIPKSQRPWGFL